MCVEAVYLHVDASRQTVWMMIYSQALVIYTKPPHVLSRDAGRTDVLSPDAWRIAGVGVPVRHSDVEISWKVGAVARQLNQQLQSWTNSCSRFYAGQQSLIIYNNGKWGHHTPLTTDHVLSGEFTSKVLGIRLEGEGAGWLSLHNGDEGGGGSENKLCYDSYRYL